jgi:putative membrane-bound dehydrogenase-like protein
MKWLIHCSLAGGVAAVFAGMLMPQANLKATVTLNGHVFTLPAGFTIELAAAPPLTDRPITIDLDEEGRLYISESSGSNENVNIQLQKKPHKILRLEDKNGDGVFDQRTVFADGMMFPEGSMWLRGSLYVAAPPSIWKLTDTNGDGVADERIEWFKGKTLTGCANDLHGPYRGPDGWIYWGKGAFAQQTYERPDQNPLVTRAAHIFRCRPDGTGIEPVTTGGMDNPVDVAFLPSGESFFTSTFLQYPAGGKRDGILHAVHGGLYGKEYLDVLNPHPWTSPKLMPPLVHSGPAAISGLACYESTAFGLEYEGNLFACLFNLQKVTRHVLTPDGGGFKSADSDFVVSDNKDFHPTDIVEDADGSLLIVDTGGWYKLCCPTSQLVKPDVLGAVYRVRKVGGPKVDDPRGRKLDWDNAPVEELVTRFDDPRPYVRQRAKETLAERGPQALPALRRLMSQNGSPLAQREAVWTLVRIDDARARALVRSALKLDDETVRQAALHGMSRWRDHLATDKVLDILKNGTPHNRRAAAEVLGRSYSPISRNQDDKKERIPTATVVAALVEALGQPHDHTLHHSLTYALIEIEDAPALLAHLKKNDPEVRRALLMSLENMDGGTLTAAPVVAALSHADADLRAAAWWIVSRHADWGKEIAGFMSDRLASKNLTAADHKDMVDQLAKMAKSAAIQDLLTDRLKAADVEQRRLALAAMAQANLKDAPLAWLNTLADMLSRKEVVLIGDAVSAARSLRLTSKSPVRLQSALADIGADAAQPPSVRLGALAALPAVPPKLTPELFRFLRDSAQPSVALAERTLAADILSRAKLSNEQLIALADTLPTAGPLEVDRLLEPFTGNKDDAVGQRLVTVLQSPSLKPVLRVDGLKRRLKDFGPAVQERTKALYAAIDAESGRQLARLETMLGQLPAGDVHRGQVVFNRPKNNCVACHAIGYVGGKSGPDLTRIGAIRVQRDLLEAIVFPSASFVRGYEPVQVLTRDGKAHNGLIQSESPEEMILSTGPSDVVRVARRDIDEIQPSRVSVMPAGLEQQLSMQELADLVAFLQACK